MMSVERAMSGMADRIISTFSTNSATVCRRSIRLQGPVVPGLEGQVELLAHRILLAP